MLAFGSANWVAVIVAAIVGLIVGFVYYAPQVLGRRWAASGGFTLPTRPAPMAIGVAVVSSLVTAYVLDLFVKGTGATSIVDGAIIGFLAWLGFVLTWTLAGAVFERRSWEWVWITVGQGLISLVVVGAILGYFH